MQKAEEEISKPSLDLKKSEGGLAVPAGAYGSLDKSDTIELAAANNVVETLNTVSQGNPEIPKGERFSISHEISQEEDEKMSKIEVIASNDSSLEEKPGNIEEELSQNAEIEFNKQEANLELKKQASIGNPDLIMDSSNEANEMITNADPSYNIQEELEEKNIEEMKDTEPVKLPAVLEKGEGTEATDPADTSVSEKDQFVSDSTGDTLTSKSVTETNSEISEVSGKELQNDNPYKEVACIHESAADAGEKPEEMSKEREIEEHPKVDIPSSSVSDEIVKESIKEGESIPMKSIEKANSSTELEDSTRDTKEKTLVERSTDTVEPESTPVAPETEDKKQETDNAVPTEESSLATTGHEGAGTNTAELESAPAAPETEDKKQETDNAVPTEESSLATTGHEGAGVDGVGIDVEPADSSVSFEKGKEIYTEEGMQDRVVHENSETPLPQATYDTLMEKEDNPTLDVPKIEAKETGTEHLLKESGVHTEQETGKCNSVAETSKGGQSSDLGFVKEKIEDGKQLDEAMGSDHTSGICEDVEKVIQAEDGLATNLAEQETEVPTGAPDQISKVKNMNVNEEKSKQTIPELSKSQSDHETIPDVQNQESEQKINEEPENKLVDEQNANEMSKTVILSEEVEDYTSVSNECLKERESKEQVETKNLEVEEYSTKDQEASLIVESAERKQDQEGESEEKVKDIVHEPKQHVQEKSDETVTKVGAVTSLDNTEMNVELVNSSKESTESDSNQETKQVENPQQEEEKTEPASEPKVNEAEQTKAVPETSSEYPSESIPTSAATLPSKDEEIETAHLNEKIGKEIHKDAEIVKHESTIEEVCLQKEGESEPKAVSVGKTIVDEALQIEEPDDQIQTSSTSLSKDDLSDAKQAAVICLEKEEVEDGKKDETDTARTMEVEEPKHQSSASALTEAIVDQETSVAQASLAKESRETETSALTSEKHETKETEPQKDESPPKILEQTNVEVETVEKAFDNESIKQKLVKPSAGENQCDNTNETIVNEVSKEELLEVKEVTETSNLIAELEEPAKHGYGVCELQDKLIEDKALETTQTEEDILDAQKISENEIIEKQIVCEDKTTENPSPASSVMPTEEAGPEGAKGSDNQISSELEPTENTEIPSSIVKEHAPIDFPDKVAVSSQKAEVEDVKEVYPKEADIGHGGDKRTDSSGKKITDELTSDEDLTKIKELKDEHTAEKTNETLKIPKKEIEKDGANNNVEKETLKEDQTVKDQEQAQVVMKEATTEARELQPGEAIEISHVEEKTDTSVAEINSEHASANSGNLSLSDILQRSAEEKIEGAEPGGDQHNKNDSGSDAPVIVEAPRDAETKPHKKSQNILSGVGSKVKNSISKVKKAITGKSSHSKEPKAISPKGNDK